MISRAAHFFFAAAFFWLCAGTPLQAAEPCGSVPAVSSSQDAALLRFAQKQGIAFPEAFRNIANALHLTGRLPACYLTKDGAQDKGWHPGLDLWRVAPGAAIGGDRFGNRERLLPSRWNGRYIEADLDYLGRTRGSHRLIFVRDMKEEWLIFVTTDHYRSFTRFEPSP